jgi:gamma-glutamylcyclotransferase (GGCT)/AIG2-like uncharacterized protein YtfP
MALVFVYGSLRRSQRYHAWLRGAQFLASHVTRPGYTMLDLGPHPGVVQGGSHAVTGEIYRVDNAMLARLDRLEDAPRQYARVLMNSPHGACWIYLYRQPTGSEPVIRSGDWLRR